MKSNEVYGYMKSFLKLVLNYLIKKNDLNENKKFFFNSGKVGDQ